MQTLKKTLDILNYPKQYSKELYTKTKHYQKLYGFKIGVGEYDTWNNESDAFKHTFGAAEIALKTCAPISKFVTDYHESHQDNNPAYEENMDKWNNLEGRKIAQEIKKEYSSEEIKRLSRSGKLDDIIAEKVMQKMRNGELITNPKTDKRKYTENSFIKKLFNVKNRVLHENELTFADLEDKELEDVFWDQALDGLPTKESLDNRVARGELVYIKDYVRSDGTKVSGYYRTYPKE